MILIAVERQAGKGLGVGQGPGQVAGSKVDLCCHQVTVGKLEPGKGSDRDRFEQVEPGVRDPHRCSDLVLGQLDGGEHVQPDALQDGVP